MPIKIVANGGRSDMIRVTTVVIPLCLALPAFAQEPKVDPEAETVLRAMSDYMAAQSMFTLTADASTEILLRDGRKVQLTATSDLTVDRAKGLRVQRQGVNGDMLFVFDGSKVSVFSGREGVYLSLPAEGGIDGALDEVRSALGTEVAGGADLLYANPYDGLMLNVESGHYMGKAYVDGVLTDHLSYRAEDIDWQLWVRSGEEPVPVKYVITSKWVTAAPQFSVEISDFTLLTESPADSFVFTPPADAKEITLEQLPDFDLLAEE